MLTKSFVTLLLGPVRWQSATHRCSVWGAMPTGPPSIQAQVHSLPDSKVGVGLSQASLSLNLGTCSNWPCLDSQAAQGVIATRIPCVCLPLLPGALSGGPTSRQAQSPCCTLTESFSTTSAAAASLQRGTGSLFGSLRPCDPLRERVALQPPLACVTAPLVPPSHSLLSWPVSHQCPPPAMPGSHVSPQTPSLPPSGAWMGHGSGHALYLVTLVRKHE